MIKKKNLFAGPYNDEFGHELFACQNFIRYLSKSYDKTTVCSKSCMKFLYEDFVDEFLPLDSEIDKEKYSNYEFVDPKKFYFRDQVGFLTKEQSFIKYGSPIAQKYDIIFHARRKEGKLCRNLGDKIYDNLYETLKNKYSITFIGSKSDAYCPNGASDLRGIELKDLANIFCSSKLVVGQSSGPIHFASLCGTPHLTWGGFRAWTFIRYAHIWNPFKTKCYLLEDTSNIGYLRKRAKVYKLPEKIFSSNYFSIINTKEHRLPSIELLYNTIEKILNE